MSIIVNNAIRFIAGTPGGTEPPAWAPTDLTNLTHWFDPSDATTVTLSGSSVTSLADKSGNGNNATPLATAPTIASAYQNGLDALNYGTTIARMRAVSPVNQFDSGLFFMAVFNQDPVVQAANAAGPIQKTSGGTPDPWDVYNNIRNIGSNGIGFIGTGSTSVKTLTSPTLFGVNVDPAGPYWRDYVNGTQDFEYTGSFSTWNDNAGYVYLGGRADTQTFQTGYLMEVIVCNGALTDLDRQKAEGYLAHKWGLTAGLPAGHPYKTEAP